MGPLRDILSGRGLQFAVAGNVITDHITHDETTNKHQEADTLLINCITFSKLDGESACIYASDVDVAVLLIAHRNILSYGNVYFGVIAEKLNIDSLLEFLGNESAKCLFTFHYLTGCDTVVKFQISKESRTKLFLQLNDQDIFKAFESLQGGHAKNY